MPVPDKVIFGPGLTTGTITYGEIRALTGENRFYALKTRMDTFLIEQINELGKPDGGSSKVYSPFPLFLLTCVAIEALGKALYRPSKKMSDEDSQREGFLAVCDRFDKKFSRQLNKEDKKSYDLLWGKDEHKKVKSISHIIYRIGRHTMVHGFRCKGVYLTESCETWQLEEGAVVINPYWFWRTFKNVYENAWIVFFANKHATNPQRVSASDFLNEILG